jgi:hypothetical protein
VSIVVGPAASGPSLFILSRGPTQVDDGSIVVISYTAEGPPVITLDIASTLVLNINIVDSPRLAVSASGAPPLTFVWETLGDGAEWVPIGSSEDTTIFSPPRSTWSQLGTSIRVRVSNALGRALSSAAAVERSTLLPPTVTIQSPSSLMFSGGQRLTFTAVTSPSSTASVSWTAMLNHAHHQHPLFTEENATLFDFTVPRVGESSTNVSLSIVARAVDVNTGLVGVSAPVTLLPQLGSYALATEPRGLAGIVLDGSAAPTQPTVAVAGMMRDVSATLRVVNASGSAFTFQGWSDGVADTRRRLTVPDAAGSPLLLVARYEDDAAINAAAVDTARSALISTAVTVVLAVCAFAFVILVAVCCVLRKRCTRESTQHEPSTGERARAARAPRPSPLSPSMRLRSPTAVSSP